MTPYKYHGRRGRHARKRCPHSNLVGIYGDMINAIGDWRLHCRDCGRYLDGPVLLADMRQQEREGIDHDYKGDLG